MRLEANGGWVALEGTGCLRARGTTTLHHSAWQGILGIAFREAIPGSERNTSLACAQELETPVLGDRASLLFWTQDLRL